VHRGYRLLRHAGLRERKERRKRDEGSISHTNRAEWSIGPVERVRGSGHSWFRIFISARSVAKQAEMRDKPINPKNL